MKNTTQHPLIWKLVRPTDNGRQVHSAYMGYMYAQQALQAWGRLHANTIDYNYNYFRVLRLLITITITFSKCNRLQLQITLQSNHDYIMITFDYF